MMYVSTRSHILSLALVMITPLFLPFGQMLVRLSLTLVLTLALVLDVVLAVALPVPWL